jgi:hypothetical protein
VESRPILSEFDHEISRLERQVDHLDKTRRRYPIYDDVIGSPQDKILTRIIFLELLRDHVEGTYSLHGERKWQKRKTG